MEKSKQQHRLKYSLLDESEYYRFNKTIQFIQLNTNIGVKRRVKIR